MPRLIIFFISFLFLFYPTWRCEADDLQVMPIHLYFNAQHYLDYLTLNNLGDSPIIVEIRPYLWQRINNKDIYTKSSDIFVSPPIIKIAPFSSQIVRIALQNAPSPIQSTNYRVYIQEIPPPPKPGFIGVQIAMRLGVPIYVTPVNKINKNA